MKATLLRKIVLVIIIQMSIKQIEGYTVYLSQILGRGSFGNVYKGYCDESKETVAVKIIAKDWSRSYLI